MSLHQEEVPPPLFLCFCKDSSVLSLHNKCSFKFPTPKCRGFIKNEAPGILEQSFSGFQ